MKKKLLAVILAIAVSCQSLPVYAGEMADIFSDSGTEMSEEEKVTDDFSDGEAKKNVETTEEMSQTDPEFISPEEEPAENILKDDQNENDSSDENSDENQVSAYSADIELTYGDYKYIVSGQEATVIKYIGSESTVKLPEKINNYVVNTIGERAFQSCLSLTEIEIPDSVEEIGDSAFQNCGSLTEVTGGRRLKKIGYEAFEYCRKLESITLSSTIKEFSGSLIFDECDCLKTAGPSSGDYNIKIGFTGNIPDMPFANSELENVVLPEGLTELNTAAFGGCTKLKQVTLPPGLKSISSRAFQSCSSLTEIEIPDSVEEIGDSAFQNCGSLTEVTGGRRLKKIGYEAFEYCRKLESITLSSTIKEFSGSLIFDECDCLKTAGPSSGDYNIKIGFTGNIPDMPFANSELENVVLPEGLTELNTAAFGGCTKLKQVTLPPGLKSISSRAFQSCSSLTEIEIPDSVEEIGDSAFQNCGSLTEVTGGRRLKKIGYEAFEYCRKLESITLSSTIKEFSGSLIFDECDCLKTAGPSSGDYNIKIGFTGNIPDMPFANSELENVVLPEGLTELNTSAFGGCTKLKQVTLPPGLKSISSRAFQSCSSLTEIEIPDSVEEIGDSAFQNCGSLTEVTGGRRLKKIGYEAFEYCRKLESITLSSTIKEFSGSLIFDECDCLKTAGPSSGDYNIKIGFTGNIPDMPFANSELENVVLPEGLTELNTSAFGGCTKLKQVTLPPGLKSISSRAFQSCSSLTEIEIPDSVEEIGDSAFQNCGSLTEVTGGRRLKKIGYEAFEYCRKLESITLSSTIKEFSGSLIFDECDCLKTAGPSSGDYNIKIGFTGNIPDMPFANSELENVVLPEGLTELNTSAFGGCTKLKQVTLPPGLKSISSRAFQSCSSLTEIEIPDSVEEIGDSAFQNCGSLTEVTGGRRLKKIGYEAFEYCRKLESITLYPTITSISGFAFDECQFLTIYGYTGTYAETYASGQNIPFRSLGEYTSKYEEYDYTENLNRWIQDEGTASAMAYLTRDGNFMNSMLVAQWDDSFIDSVVETMSNMYFRGKDGWKQIFSGETSQNQAREVLIALLDSYSGTVLDLSQAETTKKFAKIYLDTFKQGDWAYAVAYGLSNDEIKKLASVCTEDTLSAFFVDKKYDDLADYLQNVGHFAGDSKVIKCIKSFSSSKNFAKTLSDGLDFISDGLSIIKVGTDTIKRYYDIVALAKADEMYSEMLLYLKNNCEYDPICEAAKELYGVIHGTYENQMMYLSNAAFDELSDVALDSMLTSVASALPLGIVIYKSYKYSTGLANILFNTGDTQKQVDNMRCVAYIGYYLSNWMQYNKKMYQQSKASEKNYYAKRTVFAFYMLMKSRTAGEKSVRKYLDMTKKSSKKEYTYSLQVTSTLEAIEKCLKARGVLGKYSNSVISCPVNVEVYDKSGNKILTVYDGKESSGNIGDIYYNVTYHPLDQDYVKIINLPQNNGYTLRCIATDMGKVDYFVSDISADGTAKRKETDDIPVFKGSTIAITNIEEDKPSCKLLDEKGSVKEEYAAKPEKTEYIEATGIKTEIDDVNLKIGEKILLNAQILPDNVATKNIIWSSADDAIVKINSDGVVEGMTAGETTVRAAWVENRDLFKEIKVTVVKEEIPVTPTVTPIPQLSAPKLSKLTASNNSITVTWKKVFGANGYQVYRKIDADKWIFVKTTKGTSYKDTKVKAGYKYTYIVKAYRTVNGKKTYSSYNKKGLSGKLNTTVSLKTKNNTVSVNWKKTNGASGYYIYRATSKRGKYSKIKTITSGKTLKYTDKKVKKGKTYYYKVVPFRKISGKAVKGAGSVVKSIALKKKRL